MILAAHQPNFFPWLGYFNKIYKSDVFVLLDDVQMVKTGSTWFNRSNFLINNEARFVSISVSRPSGVVSIREAQISDSKWKKKLTSTLKMTYGNHPHFKDLSPAIFQFIDQASENLCEFNLSVIYFLIELLGLKDTKIALSSQYQIESTSTQRLIDLVKLSGCDTYLEGGGAQGYQEDNLFTEQKVSLIKQNFNHPVYPQRGSLEFIKGLSILDALFNCGVDETKKLIMSGEN